MTTSRTKLIISLTAAVLMVVHLIWPQIKVDAITLGLFIVAALPWFSSILESAELPGGWKLEFKQLQTQQGEQQSDINTLKFLVSHFVSEAELAHLQKLNAQQPFPYKVDDTTHFFTQELRRLRSLGLIAGQPARGIRTLERDGQGDVKSHFTITEQGKAYLKLHEQSKTTEAQK